MLQNLIAYINELSGGNQFIGGVLLGAISGVILSNGHWLRMIQTCAMTLPGYLKLQIYVDIDL